MASSVRVEQSAESFGSSFGPHVGELHEFFRSRSVKFGSAEDLQPFVERVEADASFRDEMASMVRTIIYQERDGLSRLELIELLTTAVGGSAVESDETPGVRESVRGLMAFVEGVFRTRRNPGAAVEVGSGAATHEPQPDQSVEAAAPVIAELAAEDTTAAHPTTDIFYRAQVVAKGEAGEALADERPAGERIQLQAKAPESDTKDVPEADEHWHVPLEGFASAEPERGSKVWLWIAAACALLLAFSAGLFVRQRMLVPLRDPNQPYEAQPPEEQASAEHGGASGIPLTPPPGNALQPAGSSAATGGGSDSANAAPSVAARPVSATGKSRQGTAALSDANLTPRYMAPAVVGASPMLMASHLVYAPPPAYPMMAELTRTQGRVQVEAVVGKDGRVVRAQAISGHHLLRGAAVREVYQRRYRPYTLNDRPTDVATVVTVYFRLK